SEPYANTHQSEPAGLDFKLAASDTASSSSVSAWRPSTASAYRARMRPSSRSRRERVISRARATLSAARPSPAAASPPSTFRALLLCRAKASAQPDCAAGAAHAAWRASSQKTFERQSRFAPLRDRQQPLVSTCGRGELHAERHFVVRHRDRDGDGGKSEQRPQRATRRVSGLSEFPRRRRRAGGATIASKGANHSVTAAISVS